MTKYLFFCNSKLQVEASITQREGEFIGEYICDTQEMIDLVTVMQASVDASLRQLDANRMELQTLSNKEMN